jgi:hypothetical protein
VHWIETLFGASPDGGSGITEILYAVVVVAGTAVTGIWVQRSRARRPDKARRGPLRSLDNVLETLGRHQSDRFDA